MIVPPVSAGRVGAVVVDVRGVVILEHAGDLDARMGIDRNRRDSRIGVAGRR